MILALLAAAYFSAAPAGAGLHYHGHFSFYSYTKNTDPVNLLLVGGQPRFEDSSFCTQLNQSGRPFLRPYPCWDHIIETTWRAGKLKSRDCNGHDDLRFYVDNGPTAQRNPKSESTAWDCRNQLHIRNWTDDLVNDLYHNGQFTANVAYYEERCRTCRGKGSHHIADDWEDMEYLVVAQIGRSTKGEPSWCTAYNWRVMAHQHAGRYRNWYNDGRVSRISSQRQAESQPYGRRCLGG
jgi:hypothetical protein